VIGSKVTAERNLEAGNFVFRPTRRLKHYGLTFLPIVWTTRNWAPIFDVVDVNPGFSQDLNIAVRAVPPQGHVIRYQERAESAEDAFGPDDVLPTSVDTVWLRQRTSDAVVPIDVCDRQVVHGENQAAVGLRSSGFGGAERAPRSAPAPTAAELALRNELIASGA
jgi:hypothetical protein